MKIKKIYQSNYKYFFKYKKILSLIYYSNFFKKNNVRVVKIKNFKENITFLDIQEFIAFFNLNKEINDTLFFFTLQNSSINSFKNFINSSKINIIEYPFLCRSTNIDCQICTDFSLFSIPFCQKEIYLFQ